MSNNNIFLYRGKIALELVKDFLFFPIWWYSFGVFQFAKKMYQFLCDQQKSLALSVWIKNILTPMYGQYDLAGRLISFFIRLFQIIARSIIMIFWILILICIIVFWLFLPVLTVSQIIFQLYS